MRKSIMTGILALATTGTAVAETVREGCYHRDYTDAHLAKHPDQVVDWITMIVENHPEYGLQARMMVAMANQGHARRSGHGGQILQQSMFCFEQDNGKPACAIDCDGGSFVVTKQNSKSLTFQTQYLSIGETDDCGGATDLAEIPGKPVRYRLDVVSDSACDGL